VILAGLLHGRILTQNRNRSPDYRGGHVYNLRLGHPDSSLPREVSKWVFLGTLQTSLSEPDEKGEEPYYPSASVVRKAEFDVAIQNYHLDEKLEYRVGRAA